MAITPYILIDLQGVVLSDDERYLLAHPLVAGVIFFQRNYESKTSFLQLVASIKAVKPNVILSVDQEGGRVQRFIDGFSYVPAMREFNRSYPFDAKACEKWLYQSISQQSIELNDVGINVNFSPVLDLDDLQSAVIGERALGETPDRVLALSRIVIRAQHDNGLPSIGKHFPGHGGVVADSHFELPVDLRSLEEVMAHDMQPFATLSNELDGMMSAHILFEKIDTRPVTFSPLWLTTILRDKLGFHGVVFSDDLTMKATVRYGDIKARATQAIEAGCDFLIVSHQRDDVLALLDANLNIHSAASCQRINTFLNRIGGKRCLSN